MRWPPDVESAYLDYIYGEIKDQREYLRLVKETNFITEKGAAFWTGFHRGKRSEEWEPR